MKLVITLLLINSISAFAIYGKDSIQEQYEVTNPIHKKVMQATAYELYKDELKGWTFSKYWSLVRRQVRELGLCTDEKYIDQSRFRNKCSGVLIKDDLIVTAGNCTTAHYCSNDLFYWVFDYGLKSKDDNLVKIRGKKFYKCDEVLKRVYDPDASMSYTLIRLKKKVLDREPVKLSSKIDLAGVELVTAGHPKGMPLKLSSGQKVYDQNDEAFLTNSDLTGENVGAGVFNSQTSELEGILVYGTEFFQQNSAGCVQTPNMLDESAGEVAIKASYLREKFKEFL
jgi:V8-like Glu-specific endopeptidase